MSLLSVSAHCISHSLDVQRRSNIEENNKVMGQGNLLCAFVFVLFITGAASVGYEDILMLSSRIDGLYKKVAGLGKDVSSLELNLDTLKNESSKADIFKYAESEMAKIPTNGLSDPLEQIISEVTRLLNNGQQMKADEKEISRQVRSLKEDVSLLRSAFQKNSCREDLQRQIDELRAEMKKQPKRIWKDCAETLAMEPSSKDGVYTINPDGRGPFKVFCDMTTAGGGWTVFQRRQDGSVDFYKYWADYKAGFGQLDGEFWLGNDKIHRLTAARASQLRIDMKDQDDAEGFATYSTFTVSDVNTDYRLYVTGYNGDRGDSLTYHNRMKFSTRDHDRDNWGDVNCAEAYKGAWWYASCTDSHLNGNFGEIKYGAGITWYRWHGPRYSLKFVEMKLKPT